jgi:hypothetical protein
LHKRIVPSRSSKQIRSLMALKTACHCRGPSDSLLPGKLSPNGMMRLIPQSPGMSSASSIPALSLIPTSVQPGGLKMAIDLAERRELDVTDKEREWRPDQ